MIVLYLAVYTTLAGVRHRTFLSYGFDLGLFDQVFWKCRQRAPVRVQHQPGDTRIHSHFGDHFSPVHGLLAPVYAAYPHPKTLIVVQSLFIALGAIPSASSPGRGLRSALPGSPGGHLLSSFLRLAYITLSDFHDVALSVLPQGTLKEGLWLGW